jgi:hypothetical protein
MPGEVLWKRNDGIVYRKGDLVRLEHDEDFAEWNNLWSEMYGTVVDKIVYEGIPPQSDCLAEILVGGRLVIFEWEDLEPVHESG